MCVSVFRRSGGGVLQGLIELWEKRPTGGSVSGVALGCLIRKACGARCGGEVIPARSHLEAWVNIWVRSAGLGLVLAGWLLVGGGEEKKRVRCFLGLLLIIFCGRCELCWCGEILFTLS